MKQIKPGTLCFLKGSRYPENNGRVVTTVKRMELIDGIRWSIISSSPLKCGMLYSDGSIEHMPGYVVESTALESCLIPIDADPDGTENEDWLVLRRETCKPTHA